MPARFRTRCSQSESACHCFSVNTASAGDDLADSIAASLHDVEAARSVDRHIQREIDSRLDGVAAIPEETDVPSPPIVLITAWP